MEWGQMELWEESDTFDGWMDPKYMLENGHHCSEVVGHMWTSMLVCIA